MTRFAIQGEDYFCRMLPVMRWLIPFKLSDCEAKGAAFLRTLRGSKFLALDSSSSLKTFLAPSTAPASHGCCWMLDWMFLNWAEGDLALSCSTNFSAAIRDRSYFALTSSPVQRVPRSRSQKVKNGREKLALIPQPR